MVLIPDELKGSSREEPKAQVPCHGCFCYGKLLFPPTLKWVIKDDHI